MNPIALQIGPFSIKWYSLMILLGVIAGIGLLLKEGKKYNYPKDFLFNLCFWAIIFGFIGARIYYVLFIYYWSSEHSDGELDFFIQRGARIIPIEVKAEENVRAKSLRHFILANPSLKGLRFSMADYQEQDWMTNIPLYAVSEMACVSSRK